MSSKIKKGLEDVTVFNAKSLAKVQTGIDRILWGKKSMVYSAALNPDGSTSLTATNRKSTEKTTKDTVDKAKTASTNEANQQGKSGKRLPNPLDLGLIPLLDILVSVDVCDVLNYTYSRIGGPSPKPRRPVEEQTGAEKALYYIQDQCLEIQRAIDTFYSYPDQLIGRYTKDTYQEVTQKQIENQNGTDVSSQKAYEQGNVPGATTSGLQAKKFNLFSLLTYIQTSTANFLTTKDADGKEILTPEDTELINEVPLLQQNLTSFTDFLGIFSRYPTYQSIPDEDVQKILRTVDQIRAMCVVIQSLDFRSPASFLALLPSSTVQAQFAELQKYINPTEIIPTLTRITQTINSFQKYIQQAQRVLAKAQVIVRIGIVILRVFRIIVRILKGLPIPNKFTSMGSTNTSSSTTSKLEGYIILIEEVLEQVRSLLNVFVSFIRYVQVNINEILTRINLLIRNLTLCENLKTANSDTSNSPIVSSLVNANDSLVRAQSTIDDYLVRYTNKLDEQKTFGGYTIRVVEEQLADEGIVNKRRRGVALDKSGKVVVASDLTFATDENIIIQEVKLKLTSQGFVNQQPNLSALDAVIDDVAAFLDDDDLVKAGVAADDFTIKSMKQDIQRYADAQPLGRELRRQSKRAMRDAQKQVRRQITRLKGENIIKTPTPTTTSQIVSGTYVQPRQENYEVRVFIGEQLSKIISVKASNADEAVILTKQRVDPDNRHQSWKYNAKKQR